MYAGMYTAGPFLSAGTLSPSVADFAQDDPEAVLARTDAHGRFDADLELPIDRPPLAGEYD
jgi:hypothetical protein